MASSRGFHSISNAQKQISYLFVFLMIMSMLPWPVYFFLGGTKQLILQFVISMLAYAMSPGSFKMRGRSRSISFFFLLAAIMGTYGTFNAYLGTFIRCVPFLFFIAASDQIKTITLSAFNKVLYWILSISLVMWVLNLIGVPFPHRTLTTENSIYYFDNYFFFVKNIGIFSIFPRFQSVFLEPGYLGCISVFMIFLNKYNFRKWYNIVYLGTVILSFSLAAWLLFFIGYIPYISQRGRGKWAYLLLLLVIVGAYYYFSHTSEVVQAMINERLVFENGEMVGYNRSGDAIKDVWRYNFWNTDKWMFGLRERYDNLYDFGASVDLVAYIIRYGLFAAIAYIVFMLTCLSGNRSFRGVWFFIISFAFVFRGYTIMFWDAFLMIYLAGLQLLLIENKDT
ncbi:MAG: hypothetical protein J5801_06930 [Bacteroidales bacterium]|nr:hypothetical protein [Bacteroidales bacterium]